MISTYKRKLQLLGVGFIVLAVVYAKVAVSYGTSMEEGRVEAGVVPLGLGAALVLLSIALIFTAGRNAPLEEKSTEQLRSEVKAGGIFFLCLVAYALLVSFIGFLAATLVGVAGILRFYFHYSIRRALLFSGTLTALCYLIFVLALGVDLP